MISQEQRPPHQPLVASNEINHLVSDLTVTAAADVTLASLQAKLAEEDQWLPIDGDPSHSLARLIEMNSSGPLRLGYGAWRDLLLGMQFETPSRRLITAGAATMKNVAGYDLTKLMVGQHGLLGKLVTITARSYKRPTGALIAQIPYSIDAFGKLLTTPCRPQWALANRGHLYCGYLGNEITLRFYESHIGQYGADELRLVSVDDETAFRSTHWLTGRVSTLFRASVPPVSVLKLLNDCDDRSASADPAFGIVVGSCLNSAHIELVSRKTAELGGTVVYDSAEQIQSYFQASGAQLKLLQRIQSAFAE